MTIMFLVRSLDHGGAERQMILLAKGLRARGHDIIVALFYGGWPDEQELRDAGVRVVHLEKHSRWDLFSFATRLIRLVRKERPSILHGYHGTPNLMSLVPKPFCPGTKIVWGLRCANMDWHHYDWAVAPLAKLTVWLSRWADAHIANSKAGVTHHIAMGYPARKLICIPNGIDTDRFAPDPTSRIFVRREWGIGDDERLVGLIARLDPMKGHRLFLDAAARLAKLNRHVKFVCVGDGPVLYRDELQQHARTLGLEHHLLWAGIRTDMPAVYNALDLVVSSSSGEGLSNALSEAMACGIPCVATDVGDSAWLVGSTGAMVPPNDPEALAQAMQRTLSGPRPDAAMIRRRVSDHLSAETLITTTE